MSSLLQSMIGERIDALSILRCAGFEVVDQPESEVFICRHVGRPTPAGAVYPARPQDGAFGA